MCSAWQKKPNFAEQIAEQTASRNGYSVLLAVCSAICPASFGRVLPFCMGRTFWRMNGLMNGLTFGHIKRSFIC
jgi:hypothetical protein